MVVSGKENYVYLITSRDEMNVLKRVNAFQNPMPSIGLKMKTGLTVDFRNKELLRNDHGKNTVPLLRLQCAVYLADRYPEYHKISTQNKINFIDTTDNTEMSEELVYGLYAVLNSTLYDIYYRILNGSTQVNATEMNAIPVPARKDLERLGKKLIAFGNYSTEFCDKVLAESVYA